MQAEAAIAALDRQIRQHGQPVTLRRTVANSAAIEHSCRAVVRGYRADELVGGIQQGWSQVAISPTELKGSPFETAIPAVINKLTFDGRSRTIESVEPVSIDGQFVRFNINVSG
jgi:hypothetical protein